MYVTCVGVHHDRSSGNMLWNTVFISLWIHDQNALDCVWFFYCTTWLNANVLRIVQWNISLRTPFNWGHLYDLPLRTLPALNQPLKLGLKTLFFPPRTVLSCISRKPPLGTHCWFCPIGCLDGSLSLHYLNSSGSGGPEREPEEGAVQIGSLEETSADCSLLLVGASLRGTATYLRVSCQGFSRGGGGAICPLKMVCPELNQ